MNVYILSIICSLSLIGCQYCYCQQADTIDLKNAEAVDGYVAGFNPNPNKLLRKQLRKCFNYSERQAIRSAKTIWLNFLIDTTSKKIVKIYPDESVMLDPEILKKISLLMLTNVSVNPQKVATNISDERYVVRAICLTPYRY